jgi:hypothetical protein
VKSVSRDTVEGAFLEMLGRLSPAPEFLEQFPRALEQSWQKRTEDSAVTARSIKRELAQKREFQEKLVLKYIEGDRAIQPLVESMNAKFTAEIEDMQARLDEIGVETATFEELASLVLCFGHRKGLAAGRRCPQVESSKYPVSRRHFLPPEKGILNSSNNCLFNDLESLMAGRVSMARPERFELPTF